MTRNKIKRPDHAILHWAVIAEEMRARIVRIGPVEERPGFRHARRFRAPVAPCEAEKKCFFAFRKGRKGELSGCLCHQGGIISKVPRLHGGADSQPVHGPVLGKQNAGDRDEWDRGDFVGTADLELGRDPVATPAGGARSFLEDRTRSRPGKPVIPEVPFPPELNAGSTAFKVVLENDAGRNMAGRFEHQLFAPDDELAIGPRDQLCLRLRLVHSPPKRGKGVLDHGVRVAAPAARAITRVIREAAFGKGDGDAGGESLPHRNNDESAQAWDLLEKSPRCFLDVGLSEFGTGAETGEGAAQTWLDVALKFRMPDEKRRIGRKRGGLDAESVEFDSVAGAPLDRPAEFFQMTLCLAAKLGNEFRRNRRGKAHGQPKDIDSLVGQTIEVGLGVVINVVSQLVTIRGGPSDGTEETAGNTTPDDWLAAPETQRKEGAAAPEHFVLDPDQGATDPLRITGLDFDFSRFHADGVFFAGEPGQAVKAEPWPRVDYSEGITKSGEIRVGRFEDAVRVGKFTLKAKPVGKTGLPANRFPPGPGEGRVERFGELLQQPGGKVTGWMEKKGHDQARSNQPKSALGAILPQVSRLAKGDGFGLTQRAARLFPANG